MLTRRTARATGRASSRREPAADQAVPGAVVAVPSALDRAASASWRFLVVAAAVAVVGWVAARLYLVTVSVLVAVLVTALLWPLAERAERAGLPRAAAAGVSFLLGMSVLAAIGWFVYVQISDGFADVGVALTDALDRTGRWLETGPFGLDAVDLGSLSAQVTDYVQRHQQTLTTGAVSVATTAGRVLAGAALVLFLVFFFLYDGRRIWSWTSALLPVAVRRRLAPASQAAWATLVGYARGTVLVALFDAVLIGLGLWLLGVPLAVPLAALVFIGAFVPLVGATVSGGLAILVALASNGPTTALLVLALILVVQQVEGNVFQPFVLGRMVRLHPVAVVLAVAVGSVLAGLPGAVFGVPLAAVVHTVCENLRPRAPQEEAAAGPTA
jgi:putative heme transporter